MKNIGKKLWSAALALTCLSAPFVFVACGDKNDNGEGGGEKCTVTFDAGRGTVLGDRFYNAKVEKGSTVAEPQSQPENDDFILVGWNVTGSENDAMWKFDSDVVNEDMTLHAVWTWACTVTFDANGGKFDGDKDTYEIKVAYGSKVTAPDTIVPPDENQTLAGWNNGYFPWNFDTDVVTGNITLTASWKMSDELAAELEPFTYKELVGGGVEITGVKDKESAVHLTVPSVARSIGERAFQDCVNLSSVSLPDTLTKIDNFAFMDCASLETVDLSTGLTEIGISAFRNCAKLASIELPAGVTEISNYAFEGCSALEEVIFGANVDTIGIAAFKDCASLGEVVIPTKVTNLPQEAFYGCETLTEITVPKTCERLGINVFKNCTALVKAELHCDVIGTSAFADCSALEDLIIGAETHEISSGAFSGTALTAVELPSTVATLGSSAFSDCARLKSVDIGGGVTDIEPYTFKNCIALRSVELNAAQKIGYNAFEGCLSLLDFTIPETVDHVESDIFSGCERLVEVYNLSELTLDLDYLGLNALYGHSSSPYCVVHTDLSEQSIIKTTPDGYSFIALTKNEITGSVTNYYLLDYSGNAEILVLPASYDGYDYKIFDYAFACNSKVKSIGLSAQVTAIGSDILYGSDNVTAITVDGGNSVYTASNNCLISKADKKFVLGCKTSVIPADGSVTAIGSNVFCYNKTVTGESFRIPDSVTVVESGAFIGCDGLIRTAANGVRYVDKWAIEFYYGGASNEVDGVDLVLDEGTVGVSNGAFGSCTKLKEMIVPDSVETVGASAFMRCSAMTYVKLSSSLSVIEYQMFDNCEKLETAVIGSNVTQIEHSIFANCGTNLKVYYEGGSDDWNAISKSGSSSDKIHSVTKYFYSQASEADKWHYGADGRPELW